MSTIDASVYDGPKSIAFIDPVDMLLFIDDDLLSGKSKLYDWQRKILKEFAEESTSEKPYKANLRAANGVGKDKFILAPCATWICCKHPQTKVIITSASGSQLDYQTDTYIRQIAEATNRVFGREIWKINYRYYYNNETHSEIELFATDEPGKAEGRHPIIVNGQFAIFTSETKTIPDAIHLALVRCTGFTKWLNVSSPGIPDGHFFNLCTAGTKHWKQYHITAYDCAHLSKDYIEEVRDLYGGEESPLFKSMVLAEFGAADEAVVIPYMRIKKLVDVEAIIAWAKRDHNTAGLDLSAGGDETVLVVRNGNKVLKVLHWRISDTAQLIRELEKAFRENDLVHERAYIYGDAGGLGKPILDQLRDKGWDNVRFVLNQAKAREHRVYANRGTELWYHIADLIERCQIKFSVPDDKLIRQLASRYYIQSRKNTFQLESKAEAKAKGHPSPDRADAFVLAFSDYKPATGEIPRITDLKRDTPNPQTTQAQAVRTMREQIEERRNTSLNSVGRMAIPDLSILQEQVDRINLMAATRLPVEQPQEETKESN